MGAEQWEWGGGGEAGPYGEVCRARGWKKTVFKSPFRRVMQHGYDVDTQTQVIVHDGKTRGPYECIMYDCVYTSGLSLCGIQYTTTVYVYVCVCICVSVHVRVGEYV